MGNDPWSVRNRTSQGREAAQKELDTKNNKNREATLAKRGNVRPVPQTKKSNFVDPSHS
jgi:hypothetical protein